MGCSLPPGPRVGDSCARESTEEHLTQSSIALWVWTTNQETWTSTLDRMVFKWGENKDANRKETGQGGICALEVQEAMNGYLLASVTCPDTMARV